MKTISLLSVPMTVCTLLLTIMPPYATAAAEETASVKTSIPLNATKVHPRAELTALEADVNDLIRENAKGAFDLSSGNSAKLTMILAGLKQQISDLRRTYTTSDVIDSHKFYHQVEAAFNKHEANGKQLVLSLRKKDITAMSHECENFCWESCGHNSVGEWVCFLTCRRHCT